MDLHIPLPTTIRQYVDADETMWARIVSFIVSPPVVWAIWAYPTAIEFAITPSRGIFWASLFTLLVCLIPVSFVAGMVKMGKIGDLHMRESRERFIPYAVLIVCSLIASWIMRAMGAPPVLYTITLLSVLQIVLIALMTVFSHVSMHTMAISGVTFATALTFGSASALWLVPVIMLVSAARLTLKRHTPMQILAGILIGCLFPLVAISIIPIFG